MEKISFNLVDSSFEDVLHSFGLHLISTYKFEIEIIIFGYISYLLEYHFSSSN